MDLQTKLEKQRRRARSCNHFRASSSKSHPGPHRNYFKTIQEKGEHPFLDSQTNTNQTFATNWHTHWEHHAYPWIRGTFFFNKSFFIQTWCKARRGRYLS